MPAIILHKNARTTPAIREEIQKSSLGVKELAKKFHLSLDTIYKWKKRTDVYDRSHRRHNTLSSLTSVEEEIVKELRATVGLSIDDITEVMHRCLNPNLSKSAIYRSLRRKGVVKAMEAKSEEQVMQSFEEVTEPGYIHLDVKYLTKLAGQRSYVYVAIDRLTRYVYVEVLADLEPKTAAGFVTRFIAHFPYKLRKIITDNGFEWTDRCAGSVKEKATGCHPVDLVCAQHGIKHQLTRLRRPQTNGMVERFNRRINEAIAQKQKVAANNGKNSFHSHAERNAFILQFVANYNRTRLRCLQYHAPITSLFGNHPDYNTSAGIQENSGFRPG